MIYACVQVGHENRSRRKAASEWPACIIIMYIYKLLARTGVYYNIGTRSGFNEWRAFGQGYEQVFNASRYQSTGLLLLLLLYDSCAGYVCVCVYVLYLCIHVYNIWIIIIIISIRIGRPRRRRRRGRPFGNRRNGSQFGWPRE